MALWGTVKMNSQTIIDWSATRRGQVPAADGTTYEYECMTMRNGVECHFTLTHRYADGAEILVAKLMTESARLRPWRT